MVWLSPSGSNGFTGISRDAEMCPCFRHCVIYGVESWSGVLKWSGAMEWSFGVELWSGMESDFEFLSPF